LIELYKLGLIRRQELRYGLKVIRAQSIQHE